MREKLNATYKMIRPIKLAHNHLNAKLQRQYAASKLIEMLHCGTRVINIDESVIKFTDHRNRGWIPKLLQNQVTSTVRLEGINFICGLASSGEVFYTVNLGKTNSESFSWFMIKMVEYLDGQDGDWRMNTVFMIDNAQYHRSDATKKLVSNLKIPLMFLGPY